MFRFLQRGALRLMRLARDLARGDWTERVALLTLLVLLLHSFEEWYMRGPFQLLVVAGLAWRKWLGTPSFWYLAAALFGITIYLNWANSDNHKYLMAYWCIALCSAFSLAPEHRAEALAWNGRLLIGLCMGLAVFWRLSSDSYLNGTFFHFTLLADERFEYFGRWFGDASAASLAYNRELRELLVGGYLRDINLESVRLVDDTDLRFWAQFITWWTVILEGSIAALFLWPDRDRTSIPRNSLLILFGLTTYSFAPVRGFGWMLMVLGFAQCKDDEGHFRLAYVFAMLAIQTYTLPYGAVWEGLVGLFA